MSANSKSSARSSKRFKKSHKNEIENISNNCEIINQNNNDDSSKISIDSLPEDVLMEILQLLSPQELLTMTLVCKRFNNIVSNSLKLLESYSRTISPENITDDVISSRKYSKFSISNVEMEKAMILLKPAGNSITDLKITTKINIDELREVFMSCLSLKNLEINFLTGSIDKRESLFEKSMPMLKFDKLVLTFQSNIKFSRSLLDLFKNCSIHELHLSSRYSHNFIKPFLLSQTDLKILHIEYEDEPFEKFFKLMNLDDVKFRLTKLKARYPFFSLSLKSFTKFLENHKDSLEHLDVNNIDHEIAEVLNETTKLKTLTTQTGYFSPRLNPLMNLKNLEVLFNRYDFQINPNDDDDDSNKFPFIKSLKYLDGRLRSIDDFVYLEELTIKADNLRRLNISKLKRLHIIIEDSEEDSEEDPGKAPFKFDESNLEELEIISSKFPPNWLIDYLNRDETMLKKLKIGNCELTPEIIATIEKKTFKNSKI